MKEIIVNLPIEEQILSCALLLVFIIQMIYYFFVYMKVATFKGYSENSVKPEPISVIICARNEEQNLEAHLPIILEQEYPDYEVVVVNDCSDDETEEVLKRFKKLYPHLKTTTIKEDEKFMHGKKLALTIGIKAAKSEWLVFTDADCLPENRQWLTSLQKNFTDNTEIVLAYGGYKTRKGFLNKLIRFDTFFIALQYMSFALCRKPYMGVGRNLAYRKSLYTKNRGFASHAHILSGDDDLFVNQVANKLNTKVEFSASSHTRSNPKETFNAWTTQKKRHLTTSSLYKSSHKYLLGLEPLSRILFILLCAALAIISPYWYVPIGLFLFRLIVQQLIFANALKKFNEKHLLGFSFIFDFIIPFINLNLYTLNLFTTRKTKWK